jgi:hypothetical protein
MNLNLPHLHLILNHVPTVGTVIPSACWPRHSRKIAHCARRWNSLRCCPATLPACHGLATQRAVEVPEVSVDASRHHDAA